MDTNMKPYTERLAEVEKRKGEILDELCQHIASLPDNPGINRISESPNCFTMSFSQLSRKTGILCPTHYDFKYQYQAIVEILKNTSDFLKKLSEIINDGFVKAGHSKIMLHETVLSHLIKIA